MEWLRKAMESMPKGPDLFRPVRPKSHNPKFTFEKTQVKFIPPCKAATLRLRRLRWYKALLGVKPDPEPVYEVVEVLGGTQPMPGQTMNGEAVDHLIEMGVKVTVV